MGRKGREKLLQFVDHLVATAEQVLGEELKVEKDRARAAGTEIARRICAQYGKTFMYVPSALPFELTERDREIWAEYSTDGPDGAKRYTRDRVDQIASARNLSPQHVYSIVKLMHQVEMARVQAGLPFEEPQ